ncbi:uncharacterized protein Ir56a [Drosophila bipectinata]|uniref:uncharacterized protein Ir56a n=1 Tax=Drosophila bipectinata TaxID=42026 RepID=UPI001C8A9BF4|nr:uncharacterized protein LOC122321286 [Drosophila bipectinata]
MWGRLYLVSFLLLGLVAKSQMSIQAPVESDEFFNKPIQHLLGVARGSMRSFGFQNFVVYSDFPHIKPSVQQRLMEVTNKSVFSVTDSFVGSSNDQYKYGVNVVIVLFTNVNDRIMSSVEHNERWNIVRKVFFFLYIPPAGEVIPSINDTIRDVFKFCWARRFDMMFLLFQGQIWAFEHFRNMTYGRLPPKFFYIDYYRSLNMKFLVQVIPDPPMSFWSNSTEQSTVTGGANISLHGPIGLLVVEFIKNMNATMEIQPIDHKPSLQYWINQESIRDRNVDLVANLVFYNTSIDHSVMMDSQICLLLPRYRLISPFLYMSVTWKNQVHICIILLIFCVIFIKYFAYHPRNLFHAILSTIRFYLSIPVPTAEVRRLVLADRFLHLFSSFGMSLFYGISLSLLATKFTTGIFYPLITDVQSFQDSGLRIMTEDPAVLKLFEEDQLPRSLKNKVTFVDIDTLGDHFLNLNDSLAYVVKSTTWAGIQMYQERLKRPRLWIADDNLCSRPRSLRVPIYPQSPIAKLFPEFYMRVFESGLIQKWYRMGFSKYRELSGLYKLPTDPEIYRPLTMEFYRNYMLIYICGMSLATLVFVIELIYHRFRTMNN